MKKKLMSILLSGTMAAAMMSMGAVAEEVDYSADEGEIYMFVASPEYADAITELIDTYSEVAPNVTINSSHPLPEKRSIRIKSIPMT